MQSQPRPPQPIVEKKGEVKDTPKIRLRNEEIWRPFIDGIKQFLEGGWQRFETREPGYLKAILHAFQFALLHLKDELTIDFIRTVHKEALSGVKYTHYDPLLSYHTKLGVIRSDPGMSYLIDIKSTSKAGLEDIFNKMLSGEHNYLSLDLELSGSQHPEISISRDTLKEIGAEERTALLEKTQVYVQDAKKEGLRCRVCSRFPENTTALIEAKLSELINQFNHAIEEAAGDPRKILRAIIRFIKDSEHLHPFIDGNGRVFHMIFFYCLLLKYGFPLPIMENINRISGYSVDELMEEIEKGWKNADILAARQTIFDISTVDILKKSSPEQKLYFYQSLSPLVEPEEQVPKEFLMELLQFVTEYSEMKLPAPSLFSPAESPQEFKKLLNHLLEENLFVPEENIYISKTGFCTLYNSLNFADEKHAGFRKKLAGFFGEEDDISVLKSDVLERAQQFVKTAKEKTILLCDAAKEGKYQVVEKLLHEDKVDPNRKGDHHSTPLFEAAKAGKLDIVKLLLQNHANPNMPGFLGRTPLRISAEYGRTDVVAALLECKEIDIKPEPLYMACQLGELEVVKVFIDKKVALDVPIEASMESILNISNEKSRKQEVAQLFESRSEKILFTPLHGAILGGHKEVVEMLVSTRAVDIGREVSEGVTGLELAKALDYTEIAELLNRYAKEFVPSKK